MRRSCLLVPTRGGGGVCVIWATIFAGRRPRVGVGVMDATAAVASFLTPAGCAVGLRAAVLLPLLVVALRLGVFVVVSISGSSIATFAAVRQ